MSNLKLNRRIVITSWVGMGSDRLVLERIAGTGISTSFGEDIYEIKRRGKPFVNKLIEMNILLYSKARMSMSAKRLVFRMEDLDGHNINF